MPASHPTKPLGDFVLCVAIPTSESAPIEPAHFRNTIPLFCANLCIVLRTFHEIDAAKQ